MRREYLESMKSDGFGEFILTCEELKNCKFILAESKISAVLKSIADNKQLYSMFGAALYDFDYKTVFSDCVDNGVFVLPAEPKTAIALVFRVLVDIDSGKMPLRNFLEAYFFSDSLNESYARFGLEVISPFESYCRMFFSQANAADDMMIADEEITERYDDMGEKYKSDLRSDALSCVATLLEYGDRSISADIDRAEYSACLNGLIRCIKSYDGDDVIASFLGVKYAVAYFFRSDPKVNEVYKKLEYDIKRLSE